MTEVRFSLRPLAVWLLAFPLTGASPLARGQQFYSDNQWVAPHGVGTLIGTVGQDYSSGTLVAALFEGWEFNAQAIHYWEDPRTNDDSYTSFNFFAKHRFSENEAGTAGYGIMAGTGQFPDHLAQGQVTQAFRSWWANGVLSYALAGNQVTLDLLPGVLVNLDQDQEGENAWGFTYASRIAIYGTLPQTAIVAEVFGTAGEAFAEPSYRVGLRWESPKLILAGTYSDAFNGSGGAGFELGFMYFTEPLFCGGGCRN